MALEQLQTGYLVDLIVCALYLVNISELIAEFIDWLNFQVQCNKYHAWFTWYMNSTKSSNSQIISQTIWHGSPVKFTQIANRVHRDYFFNWHVLRSLRNWQKITCWVKINLFSFITCYIVQLFWPSSCRKQLQENATQLSPFINCCH